jgi:hypothetical protein
MERERAWTEFSVYTRRRHGTTHSTSMQCKEAWLLITYDDSATSPHHYYFVPAPSDDTDDQVQDFQTARLETPEAALAYMEIHHVKVTQCSVYTSSYDDTECRQSLAGMAVLQKIASELEHLRFVSDMCGDIQYESWKKLESIQFPRMKRASLNLMMNARGYEDFTIGVGMLPATAQVEILVNPYYECHLRVVNSAKVAKVTISEDTTVPDHVRSFWKNKIQRWDTKD